MPSRISPVAIALCFLVMASPASALNTLVRQNYDKKGRSFIRVDSVFAVGMKSGYLPFRVTIRNHTGDNRVWTLRFAEEGNFRSLQYASTFRFEVENGSEITDEVIVPIPPAFVSGSTYRRLSMTATSPGLDQVHRTESAASESGNWPTIALSTQLAQRSLLKLNAARGKGKGSSSSPSKVFGYEYDPTTLPSDWRGYSSLDVLLIDEQAWKKLSTAQKQAIMGWLRLGGRCDIYSADESLTLPELGVKQLGSAPPQNRNAGVSLGKILIQQWNGRELDSTLVNRYRKTGSRSWELRTDYGNGWQLLKKFGTKNFNPALIFFLLVIFAIIVAPVNLFYFAREGQRHKLFITTPIISIAACLIIILIIYLKDGLGGSGRRIGLADLQSQADERRLYLNQEQISRTGVMLGTGFSSRENITITPLALPKSVWNPLSRSTNSLGYLHFSNASFSGDFFRSRSEQAYAIRVAQATRARLEIRSPGIGTTPPQLFSSLGFSVTDFFYYDQAGRLWKAPDGARIDPGNLIPLESADSGVLTEWIRDNSGDFSSSMRYRIQDIGREKGRFFAVAEHPEKLLVPTAESIRWTNDFVMVTGTIPPPDRHRAGAAERENIE